jgi:F-type H+-transporting ATPase subunit delta
MVELATIARPYAEAVFKIAASSGTLAEWSQTLSGLAMVAEQPEIQALLGNPRVPAVQLAAIFMSLGPTSQAQELRHFVGTVIENGRLAALPQVATQFEQLKNEREGLVDAQIDSAFPLEPAQLAGLVADLERRYRRKVNPVVRIAPELIGGVCVTVGDEVIDGSVKAKLGAMAVALKN